MHGPFAVAPMNDLRFCESLFKVSSADPDFEYVLVDATICKTHADASSQKCGLKLPELACHAAVDAFGLPIRTVITPDPWGDSPKARGLVEASSPLI